MSEPHFEILERYHTATSYVLQINFCYDQITFKRLKRAFPSSRKEILLRPSTHPILIVILGFLIFQEEDRALINYQWFPLQVT